MQASGETFGGLKSLHHLYMQETSVAELPESFGNLSKRPVFRSSENDSPGTSAVMPNSFSNLVLLEELDARGCSIRCKIPDDWEKLSSMNILDLGDNCFHSLPSSLEGLSKLKTLSLYDCRELECVPALPWKLEQLNLANCVSLKSISDLSKLEILHDLNLTNCEKLVDDVPGLEHLTSLARLYMCGCNLSCSLAKVIPQTLQDLNTFDLRGLVITFVNILIAGSFENDAKSELAWKKNPGLVLTRACHILSSTEQRAQRRYHCCCCGS